MAAQPDVVRDRQIQAQVQAQPQAQSGDGKSSSRTVTDTIIGELLSLVNALYGIGTRDIRFCDGAESCY